jgi:hypothetical protein
MSKISRRGLRITTAAAGAGLIAAAAWATAVHAGPAEAATSTMSSGPAAGSAGTSVRLSSMPQGTVSFGRDIKGGVDVTVNAFGLTPGSSHKVELMNGRGVIATFSPLTANSKGQALSETLDSTFKGTLGRYQVVVLNGNGSVPVADLEIGRTGSYAPGGHAYQLISNDTGVDGKSWGTPQGSAVVAYDRNAKTISVTVNAKGFEPGMHAAHIQAGSCGAQGSVGYTVPDFTANAKGQIVKQTRVVAKVTTPLPATGWYLNLHQGNSSNIMLNGVPTINFRPLLCGNIVTKG